MGMGYERFQTAKASYLDDLFKHEVTPHRVLYALDDLFPTMHEHPLLEN